MEVIQKSAAPVPLDDLPKRIKKSDSAAVRLALDTLIEHLAVFEDLNPKTFAIELGLPLRSARRLKPPRPASIPTPAPCRGRDVATAILGPDTGLFIDDLRAFASGSRQRNPRLRQDGEIFSKEHDRFLQAQDALAPSG